MYLVISLLVLRAGYGIWLYQFLIIAYLFTLYDVQVASYAFCLVKRFFFTSVYIHDYLGIKLSTAKIELYVLRL